MELKEALHIIRKRVWLILVITLAASVLAGLCSKFMVSPTYQASTKLLINHKTSYGDGRNVLDMNAVNTNIMLMNSYKEIILSEAILNKVADTHPEFKLTGNKLSDMIYARSATDSQVMTVSVKNGEYKKAVEIANAVAQTFKNEISGIMQDDNVAVLTSANPNDPPLQVAPNLTMSIVVAFLLSLMVSVGLLFLLDYLDDTVKSEDDIEKVMELPMLAHIYSIRKDDLKVKESQAQLPSPISRKKGDQTYVTANR